MTERALQREERHEEPGQVLDHLGRPHFHTMEARALARLGDAKGCDRALAEAVREFERRRPEDDPGWFQYFDDAELSAESGHRLRDLRRPGNAARCAIHSTETVSAAGFVRSDFSATIVLADAHLVAADLEQACVTALRVPTAYELKCADDGWP